MSIHEYITNWQKDLAFEKKQAVMFLHIDMERIQFVEDEQRRLDLLKTKLIELGAIDVINNFRDVTIVNDDDDPIAFSNLPPEIGLQ